MFSVSKLPAHLTTCLSPRRPTALACSICPLPNLPFTTLPHYASSRTSTPILLPSSLPSRLQALSVTQDARARSMQLQPQQSRTGRQTDDLKNAQEYVLTPAGPHPPSNLASALLSHCLSVGKIPRLQPPFITRVPQWWLSPWEYFLGLYVVPMTWTMD